MAPRVAYSVGRRVGGSVERNRLRRRLRAIVVELVDELRPGAYLIGAAPGAARLTYPRLKELVCSSLQAVRRDNGPPA